MSRGGWGGWVGGRLPVISILNYIFSKKSSQAAWKTLCIQITVLLQTPAHLDLLKRECMRTLPKHDMVRSNPFKPNGLSSLYQ